MSDRRAVVVDASAVVAALGTAHPDGQWATAAMLHARLAAPEMMPFEAGGVLRKLVLGELVDRTDATLAHAELLSLPVELWPHRHLAQRAWALRENVAYYDACYVALAELLDAPLVTLDRRLAQAPGPRCAFLTPPVQG